MVRLRVTGHHHCHGNTAGHATRTQPNRRCSGWPPQHDVLEQSADLGVTGAACATHTHTDHPSDSNQQHPSCHRHCKRRGACHSHVPRRGTGLVWSVTGVKHTRDSAAVAHMDTHIWFPLSGALPGRIAHSTGHGCDECTTVRVEFVTCRARISTAARPTVCVCSHEYMSAAARRGARPQPPTTTWVAESSQSHAVGSQQTLGLQLWVLGR